MNVMTEGKDLTIAFNVRYITDVLKALSDDQVVMRFNSNVSPCVVCRPRATLTCIWFCLCAYLTPKMR